MGDLKPGAISSKNDTEALYCDDFQARHVFYEEKESSI